MPSAGWVARGKALRNQNSKNGLPLDDNLSTLSSRLARMGSATSSGGLDVATLNVAGSSASNDGVTVDKQIVNRTPSAKTEWSSFIVAASSKTVIQLGEESGARRLYRGSPP